MSRTKRNADQGFAMLSIRCPLDHPLGKIMKNGPALDAKLYAGPGWTTDRPLDGPLSMKCPKCDALGLRQDLRGSWAKINAILAEMEENPQVGKRKYVLGG